MEDDKGTGGDEGGGGKKGVGGGDELVLESRIEREKDAAPPAVEGQLQAPPLNRVVVDSDLTARAEMAGLAVAEEGGAAAALASSAPNVETGDVDAEPADDDGDKDDADESCECFVGGLPPDATEEQLLAYFEDLSPVSARVNRRRRGGECKGYGFVVFPSVEIARRACEREIKTVSLFF